jgi:hypothetical protein
VLRFRDSIKEQLNLIIGTAVVKPYSPKISSAGPCEVALPWLGWDRGNSHSRGLYTGQVLMASGER